MLECGLPDSTRTGPSAASPRSATEMPRRSPTHSRATASPAAFDMVAPLTNAPSCAAGSPSRSRTHATVSRSRSAAAESRSLTTF